VSHCPRLSRSRLGLAIVFGLALAACSAHKPSAEVPTNVVSDPKWVTDLEGYRDIVTPESVFGGNAHLIEVGPPTAPSMLLVHGIGDGGVRDFYPILPALAQNNHVYAVDLPGFGRSTHGSALYSPDNYVRFLHDVIVPRIPGAFNLVGHSMGGTLSLLYAYRHPEDVARLVLVDAAGILHREALLPFVAQAGIGSLFEPAGTITGVVSSILVNRAPAPQAVLENDFARAQLLSDGKKIAAAALIIYDFGPAIAAAQVPTLLLWGRRDIVAPLRTSTLLQARLAHAHLEFLENSSHVPMETEPALMATKLLNWFQTPLDQPPPEPAASARLGRCDHVKGARFEGAYQDLEIVGCQNVLLSRVRARELRIWDSQVTIEATDLHSASVALYAARSQLQVTGCVFSGHTAMALDGADLDVAGTDVIGRAAAAQTREPSRIIFSASRLVTAQQQRHVHEVVELQRGQAM
jgi:pimeloyl-ACP methyl ester carboxylesterase